jgi:hypothetical protein
MRAMRIDNLKRWQWAVLGLALGAAFSCWRGWVGNEGALIGRSTLESSDFEKLMLAKSPTSGQRVVTDILYYGREDGMAWLTARQLVRKGMAAQAKEMYVPVKVPAKTPYVPAVDPPAKVDPKFTVVDYLNSVKAKHPELTFTIRWWAHEPVQTPMFALMGTLLLAGAGPSLVHVLAGASAHRRNEARPRAKRPTLRKEEANILAREHLKENPTATARQLATAIGCSLGMIPRLPAWQAVQEQRAKGRQPKKSTAVSLTDRMQRVAGTTDDPLAKLIAEQEADAEPSPLEADPSVHEHERPREVRVYRRP